MLVAMVGLPGTGKSTLAGTLASHLGGIVLNKDTVRLVLFPPPVLDYSQAEDDITMAAIYQAAGYILQTWPARTVFLDGRTFLGAGQVDALCAAAAVMKRVPHFIECVCEEEVARQRLDRDLAAAAHPAGNRTMNLYRELKSKAQPLRMPHAVIDTGSQTLDACVAQCLSYLRSSEE